MPRRKTSAGEPRVPDSNEERILRVAERLFARRGYRNVTVRDIAEAAHVTHPLIYHYFGSKRGLLAAVVDRSQARMRAVVDRDQDALDLFVSLARENFARHRSYLLILSRAFADGMRASEWPGGYPGIEAILARLDAERRSGDAALPDIEMRELVAATVAMTSGWVLLEDQLLEIVGLSDGQREEARDYAARLVQDLLRRALPPGED
jgi:AcrR family transcriptional regulator